MGTQGRKSKWALSRPALKATQPQPLPQDPLLTKERYHNSRVETQLLLIKDVLCKNTFCSATASSVLLRDRSDQQIYCIVTSGVPDSKQTIKTNGVALLAGCACTRRDMEQVGGWEGSPVDVITTA